MIKAVLLDLDNTLLRNPDDVFAYAYLHAADRYFADRWGQAGISRVLLKSLVAMGAARDGQTANAEIAARVIGEATGKDREEIAIAFADFYATRYPDLRNCTEVVAEASALVNDLLTRQYAVVIATNPIYPADAVQQRLEWAGIQDAFDRCALVTHAENMHFTKSDPAYFAEIVARVGVEPDEAIMVGDHPDNDIAAAHQVGLNTFHITLNGMKSASEHAGTLSDFYRLAMQDGWLDSLLPPLLTPAAISPELRGNIGALFGTLVDVKAHYWNQHPDPNEWSPIQIICHLLESENRVQRPRLERILAEDDPFLVSPPPPPGPREAVPCDTDGHRVARAFVETRQSTLDWIAQLPPDAWTRPARHSIFGRTSLLEMAHFTAQHDRLHINQICQTLGRCH